ncbi:chemoreceptor glutamine deamidase CheD [Salinimonas sediminis]|uniref:Probable chemoreceptor glutamine deamidase CheD n=1 Tax=Salinimonas sediminis TaxID=2303538 RepID=A0A346NQ94_9ALTE|nr:chemoreceptor glutamine deamidase CheD [Salinimonas sediminis]AXR07701.1 chemoreceptor glutamine deamidase CheD [Salinimonas sediminis]
MAEVAQERLSGLNVYYDNRFERQAVKILPGEYFATNKNSLIVTVLGSCVSACLRDTKNGIFGMNHFLLPCDYGDDCYKYGAPARYGMHAMELVINEMMRMGADRRYLQAKVFGGGNVLKGITVNNIGLKNAEFVAQYLRTESIPIVASDLLGDYPRKIYFFPETGEVKVKRLKRLNNTTIMDRETVYRMKLKEHIREDDFDLFE